MPFNKKISYLIIMIFIILSFNLIGFKKLDNTIDLATKSQATKVKKMNDIRIATGSEVSEGSPSDAVKHEITSFKSFARQGSENIYVIQIEGKGTRKYNGTLGIKVFLNGSYPVKLLGETINSSTSYINTSNNELIDIDIFDFTTIYNSWDWDNPTYSRIQNNQIISEEVCEKAMLSAQYADEGAFYIELILINPNPQISSVLPYYFNQVEGYEDDPYKGNIESAMSKPYEISTESHIHIGINRVGPTCTEDGRFIGHCEICGEESDEDTIPALGHLIAPVIYKNGYSIIKCKRCEEELAKAPINYYIDYKPNGGIGHMEKSIHIYDQQASLRPNTYKREGYVFSGWTLNSDSLIILADEANVMNLSDIDEHNLSLYAVWEVQDNGETGVETTHRGSNNSSSQVISTNQEKNGNIEITENEKIYENKIIESEKILLLPKLEQYIEHIDNKKVTTSRRAVIAGEQNSEINMQLEQSLSFYDEIETVIEDINIRKIPVSPSITGNSLTSVGSNGQESEKDIIIALKEWFRENIMVATSAAGLILLSLIVIILAILSKKKKEKENEDVRK